MYVFLGSIELFAFGFAPRDYVLCDGTLLDIQNNTALFSLLGNQYGGNYPATFAVPNLLNASPISNMKYYIAIDGEYPPRQ